MGARGDGEGFDLEELSGLLAREQVLRRSVPDHGHYFKGSGARSCTVLDLLGKRLEAPGGLGFRV